MTKTSADLIRATLNELGVLAAGQDVEAEDALEVEARISPKLADLEARGVFPPINVDAIEDAAFPWLTTIIAAECSTVFGLMGERETWEAKADRAEDKLRILVRGARPHPYLRIERFW